MSLLLLWVFYLVFVSFYYYYFFYLFNFLIVLRKSLFVCLITFSARAKRVTPTRQKRLFPYDHSEHRIHFILLAGVASQMVRFNPTESTPRYLSLPSISLSYLYLSWHRSQSGVKHLGTETQHSYWVKKQNWKVKFEGEEL